jgi:uncharacterized GH25 family protein
MKPRLIWVGLIFILASLLAGCSGAVQTQEAVSDPVNFTIETNPDPPATGKTEIVLKLQDQEGKPLNGATVDVSADHTDMTGMTMSGLATEQEDGKYAITADFSMSGTWKITAYIRKDDLDVKKDFELIIP